MQSYDVVVIGGGPGGYEAAAKAASLEQSTALVEMAQLGGTCLNRGCIPTKALLHTAELFSEMQQAEQFGILCSPPTIDLPAMYARRDQVVDTLRQGVAQLLKAGRVAVYQGRGVIGPDNRVTVHTPAGEEWLQANHIILATGSSPAKPPIPGAELPGVYTSDDLLTGQPPLFKSLCIIGGGVIGMEFAALYTALGCQVTVVEGQERILPMFDRELSQGLAMSLKKKGTALYARALVQGIAPGQGGLACTFEAKGETQTVVAEAVLIATGRRANLTGCFAPGLTPAMEQGLLVVDEALRTSLPGVYAIGDIVPGPALAHKATAEGIATACHIAGKACSINRAVVPSCVYTTPEIASVGLTADEAKAQGIPTKVGKALMTANGKTVIAGAQRGSIKLVFHGETDGLLGAQLMCQRATDLIDVLATALANGLTRAQLGAVIRPHPTYCEAITAALEAVR